MCHEISHPIFPGKNAFSPRIPTQKLLSYSQNLRDHDGIKGVTPLF
jgi:hypothetical protein